MEPESTAPPGPVEHQEQTPGRLSIEQARLLYNLADLAAQAARLQETSTAEARRGPLMNTPELVDAYFRPLMAGLPVEHLRVATTNLEEELISEHLVYQGTLKEVGDARLSELFRHAILDNAAHIIIVHNHPDGSLRPSPGDIRFTEWAYFAGQLLDIEVLDHVILSREGYLSLKLKGIGFQIPKNPADLLRPSPNR